MLKIKPSVVAAALAAAFIAPMTAQAAQAGPGTWSGNQTWGADQNHGGNLTGYYYWPATQPAHPNGKRALVLVLHGCQQTAAGDVINNGDNGFNWKGIADKYGAVILAPNATGNVANFHCWDYYGASHTRTSGHVGVLLDLVNRFKNDAKYEIDPNQIYVAGLSSGGGQTMVMGCVAPDVFAGIGNNAGPALGTSSLQIGGVPSGFTAATAAANCKRIAGTNSGSFATQIANAIWGTSDYTVGQAYGPLNMDAMRQVYGGSFSSANISVTGGGSGSQHTAAGKIRTSQIAVSGMAHAWPGGAGAQNTNYVNSSTVHYPQYIMDFWFTNNLRAPIDGSTTTTTTTLQGGTSTSSTTTTTIASTNCFTSSNYAHVVAGRAYNYGGYAYALGSYQFMGVANAFTNSTLKKVATNYYVIGTCN